MLRRVSLSLSVSTIVFAAAAGSGAAQTVTECTGNLAAGNYAAVDVPPGATCTINTGTVNVTTGGMTIGAGATFFVAAPSGLLIITSGSLDSTNAKDIEVSEAHIHGHVHLDGTTGGTAIITDSFIGGTLSVRNSSVVGIVLDRNSVGGSLLDENNQCFNEGGCNSVVSNTIGMNLVCTGNTPPPVIQGTSNTVGGNQVGQCAATTQ
jgi:hypothetical protein